MKKFWLVFEGFAAGALTILALLRFKEGGPDTWRGFVSLGLAVFFLAGALVERMNEK